MLDNLHIERVAQGDRANFRYKETMAEIGPIDEETETYWMEKWGVYAAGVALLQSVGFWLGNTTGKGGRACYENGHN